MDKKNTAEAVNQYLKVCMTIAGVSKSEAARRIGVSPQALHDRMNRPGLTVKTIYEIADALDADVQLLLIDRKTGKPIFKHFPVES